MAIGNKIKERRNELKLSQRDLAKKMGYAHHSTIARIENGSVDIPQSKIAKFAEVLDTDISYLMDWEEKEKFADDELSENIKALVSFVKTIPEDKADLALKLIRTIVEDN